MRIEPRDDGLLIPDVGRWAKRKYHFLSRYLHLFSTGMKIKWPRRHYIDLFSGAGFARIRGTNEVVAGSPALAANVLDSFSGIHLCEQDSTCFDALAKRVNSQSANTAVHSVRGDANAVINEVLKDVPSRDALCVTFADPFGLHLDWETIRAVSDVRSDLIILLADNMDALRNWAKYYFDNPDSNLDRFMGEPGWRNTLASASSGNQAERLRTRYMERLKGLGYSHFDSERIANDQDRDIYTLVYASRSARGLDFWSKARAVDESGQRSLFGA
jgi:three-Cys-motif partner protein